MQTCTCPAYSSAKKQNKKGGRGGGGGGGGPGVTDRLEGKLELENFILQGL